jgi:hypothetical protein
MQKQLWLTALVLAGGIAFWRHSAPATAAVRDAGHDESTLDDQVDLALTVYNSDIALVRDVRRLQLPRGSFDLRFMDIAATVNPATVHFRSLTEPSQVNVLEQNYEYDLLEPDKLLRKYVGRDVTIVRSRQEDGTTRDEPVKARLLSYNNGPVWRIGDEIVTGLGAGQLRFPELPNNLYTRPTLIWTLDNKGAAQHRVEASYLAGKLSWSADYILTVSRDDKSSDLDGWVTLTNGSGTSFRNTRLQFVAGELHRVREAFGRMLGSAESKMRANAAPMAQESFSDYHLYTLGRKTTINNNETKQLMMLAGTGIPVQKRYVVDGQAFYYRNAQHPGSPVQDSVQVYYELRNDDRGGLGMPMPAGIVRVYQADASGGAQFVGEDHIGHTPKDETVTLKVGNAFDVTCERNQIDFKKVGDDVYELEYEITLRNHKTVPITVQVNEPIGGTWRMLRSSYQWAKSAAWAAAFTVPVAADATSVLKYRVRVTY